MLPAALPITGLHHVQLLVGRADRDGGAAPLRPRRLQHQDLPQAEGVRPAGVQVGMSASLLPHIIEERLGSMLHPLSEVGRSRLFLFRGEL